MAWAAAGDEASRSAVAANEMVATAKNGLPWWEEILFMFHSSIEVVVKPPRLCEQTRRLLAMGSCASHHQQGSTQNEAGGARGWGDVGGSARRTLSNRIATQCWMAQAAAAKAGWTLGSTGMCAIRLQ